MELELADRYGPVPEDVLALLKYSGLTPAAMLDFIEGALIRPLE